MWIASQGLADSPTGPLDIESIVGKLGFVQLDSIQVVSRAHHHIIWSRNQHYREPMLNAHMQHARRAFEHFTHDASLIPMDSYPRWGRQFRRLRERLRRQGWHRSMGTEAKLETLKERIRRDGPLSTRDFSSASAGRKSMWSRPPHKLALDYLWYAGELSTAYRDNFTKYYDLTERVIPDRYREGGLSDEAQVDWLCGAAMDRLVFASEGEIQRFWDAVDRSEVSAWFEAQGAELVPVLIEGADRCWRPAFARAAIEEKVANVRAATGRLRILNPFDPLIRDRKRLKHLFGFDYTVEMFVPAAKRQWGYYVYPLLEGDRFVGRIEIKAHRRSGTLEVLKLWSEAGVIWTPSRAERLDAELIRLARLSCTPTIDWGCRRRPLSEG